MPESKSGALGHFATPHSQILMSYSMVYHAHAKYTQLKAATILHQFKGCKFKPLADVYLSP